MPRSEKALLALAIALSATSIALLCFRPTGTIDLWWTLKVGDYIRAEGDVPRTLLWTIDAVRDLPYVCHGWLGAWLYSSVAATLGLDAVPLVPTLVGLALFGCLIALARQQGASWLLSVAVAAVGLYVTVPRLICRVEVFGYLYLTLALNLIAAYRRTRRLRSLAWLVPLALLWVNSHGSFLLLPALLLVAAAGLFLDAWRGSGFRRDALFASLFSRDSEALGAIALLVVACIPVNPYGLELIRSAFEQSTSDLWGRWIHEWQPLWAAGSPPVLLVLPAFLAAAAAVLIGFRRLSFVSLLVGGSLAALALSAIRHIPFFGIGAAFVLGDFAAGLDPGRRARRAVGASLVAALLVVNVYAATSLGLENRSLAQHPSPFITRRGLAFIRDHVQGNVLNLWDLGGLLIYFTYPQIRVAIDSRADPYPPAYFRSYKKAVFGNAASTMAFVDQHAIDHIIIDRAVYARYFRRKLVGLKGFRRVFQDERSVVLSRGLPDLPSVAR